MAINAPCNSPNSCATINQQYAYTGTIFPAGCERCTPETPCASNSDVEPGIDGIAVFFITQMDSHYDRSCPVAYPDYEECEANPDYGHTAEYHWEVSTGYPERLLAVESMENIVTGNHPLCAHPNYADICNHFTDAGFSRSPKRGVPNVFSELTTALTLDNFFIFTDSPTSDPTQHPTDPTADPTVAPTSGNPCFRYINQVSDIKLKGAGGSCRGGINDEWPGGKTCDSPYIVCLPDEHTPANPDPLNEPNVGRIPDAALYTTTECYEECAFDQRCMGFEFVLTAGSNLGQCVLIDDLDIIIEGVINWPEVGTVIGSTTVEVLEQVGPGLPSLRNFDGQCCSDANMLEKFTLDMPGDPKICMAHALANPKANFLTYVAFMRTCHLCEQCAPNFNTFNIWQSWEVEDRYMLGSPSDFDSVPAAALCFAKEDYCNPYFEAADLNEQMLECYCPNNRKGTYTKKVKRTIENTRYCEDVPEISERIQQAQANRMFHLCENWCLFETHNPKTESWYWDPWRKCWREQYAGTGTHRSYCNRVIRNPDTIEQMFIEHRSDNFCQKDPVTNEIIKEITEEPTQAPSTFDSTWYLADQEESCDDVCEKNGLVCDELTTNSIVWSEGVDPALMTNALTEADSSLASVCDVQVEGQEGWALPAISSDKCYLRHPDTEYTGCNWPTGKGFRRLCACYTA